MTILTNIPTNFFLLFEELIFSSTIYTFYRRPLSIWFLQPLWDGRWSSTKQYEKEKFFSWKYVGIVVFFIHVMVVQGSLSLFFFIFYFSFSCINNYKTCLCCYFDLKRKILDVEVPKLRYSYNEIEWSSFHFCNIVNHRCESRYIDRPWIVIFVQIFFKTASECKLMSCIMYFHFNAIKRLRYKLSLQKFDNGFYFTLCKLNSTF